MVRLPIWPRFLSLRRHRASMLTLIPQICVYGVVLCVTLGAMITVMHTAALPVVALPLVSAELLLS